MTDTNMFEDQKNLTDKEILGDDKASEYVKYDMIAEYKEIHSQAKEHITKCMTCSQTSTRHHLGIGNPLDSNAMKQGVHYINNIADMSIRYLDGANQAFEEITKENKEFRLYVREILQANKEINENILKNSKDQADEFKRQNKEYFDTMRADMKLYIKIIGVAVVPVAAGMIAIFEMYKRLTS